MGLFQSEDDEDPIYEVDDEREDNVFSGINFDNMAYSFGKTLRSIGKGLGLVTERPSPYIVKIDDIRRESNVQKGMGWALIFFGVCAAIAGLMVGWFSFFSAVACMAIAAAFGTIGVKRIQAGQDLKRFSDVLTSVAKRVGERERISLPELSGLTLLPEGELEADLARSIRQGNIPHGRLALVSGVKTLYLTDGSWQRDTSQRQATQKATTTQKAAPAKDAQVENGELAKFRNVCTGATKSLRSCATRISDGDVSVLLIQIANKVEGICRYVERHPETVSQVRRLGGYYLPETVKLAESYAELEQQGAGPHASATRDSLKETLSMVLDALTRLADNLLQDQSMDLKSDMDVMRTMLEQDGLSDNTKL